VKPTTDAPCTQTHGNPHLHQLLHKHTPIPGLICLREREIEKEEKESQTLLSRERERNKEERESSF